MRLSEEQLNNIKGKYQVDRLWSFSRINNFKTCPMDYFLTYVKHEKPTEDSIYGILGNEFHNVIEQLYTNNIKYDEMSDICDEIILNVELDELKFNKSDEKSNESIGNKYYACIRHFFKHHVPIKNKVLVEQFITIKIGEEIFQGYIDAIHKENDNVIITDWKTSTIYTGKKIDKENKQLLLYALGLKQRGIPIDKIKIRWNFLKYNMITYTQKNGKEKNIKAERWAWVGKIKVPLKRNLKDMGYKENEINEMLNNCINENNIESLPQEIQKLYKIEDCYVYVDFNEDNINELVEDLKIHTRKIREKEQQTYKIVKKYEKQGKTKNYALNQDDVLEIWNKQVEDKDSYFCSNLCGFNIRQCNCWKEYLENKELFKNKNYKDKRLSESNNEIDDFDDLSWLD